MAGDKHEMMLPQWLAERRDGTYADGRRFDELCYLQCKLIVKPDRFTSPHVFKEFAELVRRAADATGIAYHHTPKLQERPEVREVLFLDTGDFHLYNNAFILRRRISYEDGFPIGDPEIVFKFRHPDIQAMRQEIQAENGCHHSPESPGRVEIKGEPSGQTGTRPRPQAPTSCPFQQEGHAQGPQGGGRACFGGGLAPAVA